VLPPADKTNADGEVEFYWIDVTLSTDYADFQYLSAFQRKDGKVVSVSCIELINGQIEYRDVPVSSLCSMTYELVGPKIQSNRYQIPTGNVSIEAVRKGRLGSVDVPKHYFIRHGCISIQPTIITNVLSSSTPVELLRKFIVENQIEGLVIHFVGHSLYKINRGHIGQELEGNIALNFFVKE